MTQRSDKVGNFIQRELGGIMLTELKDPRVGFATVIKVKCTNDLKTARIYVSVMGSDKNKRDTIIGLNNSKGFLRSRIGELMQLRTVPNLVFVLDSSLDYSMKIEHIISEINNNESENQ